MTGGFTNRSKNRTKVILPVGDGTFATAITSQAGSSPYLAAVADFNRDGKADIAVSNSTSAGSLGLLLGNGDGTFAAPLSIAVGRFPTTVVVADFDEDGNADLATADSGDQAISVALGHGDGTFAAASTVAVTGGTFNIAADDLDNDGHIDLVAAVGSSLVVLAGNGDGTFATAVTSPIAGAGAAGPLALADFDGDGFLDAVTAGGTADNGAIFFLHGNGDSTFSNAVALAPLPASVHYQAIIANDLNGDGKPDIAATNFSFGRGDVTVVAANGNGTFAPPENYTVGRTPLGIVANDYNGDGLVDLAVANGNEFESNGSVGLLFNLGSGKFADSTDVFSSDVPTGVAIADVDGNGNPDLVSTDSFTGSVNVSLGRGDGRFRIGTSFATGTRPGGLAAADFDGDGNIDIVTYNQSDASLLLGDGVGGLLAPITLQAGPSPVAIVVGDFDGDGDPDIAVGNNATQSTPGEVAILLNNGDGTFTALAPIQGVGGLMALASGDLNGDGKIDLVAGESSGDPLSILLGNGNGTFTPVTGPASGNFVGGLAIADVNGDGKADIVAANTLNASVAVYLGNGDGTFASKVTYATTATDVVIGTVGTFPNGVAVADFDGDGKADILTANQGSGQSDDNVSFLHGNGDGTFAAAIAVPAGSSPADVAVGDLNLDGAPDAVTANISGNTLTILLGPARALPALSVADLAIPEGNSGASFASLTITLSAPSTAPVTVAYATRNGSATSPADYVSTSGTIVFAPGETTKTIMVQLVGNTVVNPDKTFQVVLSNAEGATIGRGTATATIIDDDKAGTIQFSSSAYSASEGGKVLTVVVTRMDGLASGISSRVVVTGGTATPGVDFSNTAFSVTFGAGETSRVIQIPLLDDDLVEGDETITLALTDPSGGATLGTPSTALATIINDDTTPPANGDSDGDGVPDSVEAAGPGNGDANGDGVPDSAESNVATLPNAVDGRYVTLVSPAGTSLVGVAAVGNPSPGNTPTGVTFSIGLFRFSVIGIAPGGSADVTLILPSGLSIQTYEKYGPTPGQSLDHWYDFASDGTTGAVVSPGRVVLRFVDGARGDSGAASDGRIDDPGGLASVLSASDTTPPTLANIQRIGIHAQPTRLILTFSEPLDVIAASNTSNYVLTSPGRDGRFGTADDRRIAILSAVYDPNGRSVTLAPAQRLDLHKSYRLTINGGGVSDRAGNLIDGDRDGKAGGNAVLAIDRSIAVFPAHTRRIPRGPLSLPARTTSFHRSAYRPTPKASATPAAKQAATEARAAGQYVEFVRRNLVVRVG